MSTKNFCESRCSTGHPWIFQAGHITKHYWTIKETPYNIDHVIALILEFEKFVICI